MAGYEAAELAQSFQQDLARGDAAAILDMSRRWLAVEANLNDLIEALADDIATITADGGRVPAWKLYEMDRYQSLLAQLQAQMNAYSQRAIVDLMDDATKSQQLARQHAKQMLGVASGAGGKRGAGAVQTALDKLGVEATEKIAALARAGKPLDQIFQKAYPAAAAGLTNQLLTGAALGWNPRKTARLAKKAGLVQGLNHILLVYRDQQIRNYREAQWDAYNANPHVYGYMRLAAKNSRTCPACLRLDGEIYELGEHMPLHPQDRCAIIPLIEGQPLPQWQRGLDWLREQPPDVQRQVLGRQRYDMWRQGLFELDELASISHHPVWGPTAQVTTVQALLHGRGNGVVSKSAAAVLAAYKANQPAETKARTLQLDGDDQALISELISGLPKLKVGITAKLGIKQALQKMEDGQQGFTYLDDAGVLAGAISYRTKPDNLTLLEVTKAGFTEDAGNLKALQDVAQIAQAANQGMELYVPKKLVDQYLAWGFTIHSAAQNGAVMRLAADDIPAFLQDPLQLGVVKVQQVAASRLAQLHDPQATVVYRSGYALPNQPFQDAGKFEGFDLDALMKDGLDTDPFPELPKGKHAAAGMVLIHPQSGKIVLAKPTGGFGGYLATFPKGTVEPGDSLQKTAIKETFEETGFQAKIVGVLGDYEKETSVNRMYIGVVTGGEPWDAHWETEGVILAPLDKFRDYLNTGADKALGKDFKDLYEQAIEKGNGNLEAGLDALQAEKVAAVEAKAAMEAASFMKWANNKHVSVTELELALGHAQKVKAKADAGYAAVLAEDIADIKAAINKVRQENAANKNLFQGYLDEGADVLAGLHEAELQSLITWAYETRQPATNIADLEAFAAKGPVVKLPADATKAALVAHLVDVTGAPKWKLSVMTKAQIQALDGLRVADVLAAAEAAGQAHTQKYAQPPEPEPPPVPVLALPANLHGAAKSKLVNYIIQEMGVAKWKLNVMTKGEVEALFGHTQEDILAAADAAGAAHSEKYKKASSGKADTTAAKAAEAAKKGATGPEPDVSDPQKLRQLSAQLQIPLSLLQRLDSPALRALYDKPVPEAQDMALSLSVGKTTIDKLGQDLNSIHSLGEFDLKAVLRYAAIMQEPHLDPLVAAVKKKLGGQQPAKPEPAASKPTKQATDEDAEQIFSEVSLSWEMDVDLTNYPPDVLKKALTYVKTPQLAALFQEEVAAINAALAQHAKADELATLKDLSKHEVVKKVIGAYISHNAKSPGLMPLAALDISQLKVLYVTTKYDGPGAAGEYLAGLKNASPVRSVSTDTTEPPKKTQQPRAEDAGIPYPNGYNADNINSIKKNDLAAYLSPILGKSPNTLKAKTKAQLIAMLGGGAAAQPTTAATKAAVFAPGAAKKQVDITAARLAPETPLDATFAPPTGTVNITGASQSLVDKLKVDARSAFASISAQKGANKAFSAISNGDQGLIYKDGGGQLLGILALTDSGSTLKVAGLAAASDAVNERMIANAILLAQQAGKPLELWVPAISALQAKYKSWGFKQTNSNYFEVTAAEAPPHLLQRGDLNAISAQKDIDPVAAPPGATTVGDLYKVKPAQLAAHLAGQMAVPVEDLQKLSVDEMAQLVGKMPSTAAELVQQIVEAKKRQAQAQTLVQKWQGGKAFTTSLEVKNLLVAFQTLNVRVPTADLQKLQEQAKTLEAEERTASPYIPRFVPRTMPAGLPRKQRLPDPPGFPADPDNLRVVKKLGGTTGAELVQDPATGKKYVRKRGNSAGHVREELAADEVYRAAGIRVPEAKLYETSSGPVKLAAYVEGARTLANVLKSGTKAERAKVQQQLRDGFAVDALLGNWDVLGADLDNVLVDQDGNAWRIDNGGSMRYRAQGDKKSAEDWTKYPVDIWEMRSPGRSGAGAHNHKLFGDMSIYDILAQVDGLADREAAMLATVPREARQMVHDRLETMRDLASTAKVVQRDKFTSRYTDGWLEQTVRIRKGGVLDKLPEKMRLARGESAPWDVVDENGRKFDNWRGNDSNIALITQFMKANGADMGIITQWMKEQGGSSWNQLPQALKYAMAKMRGLENDTERFFWGNAANPDAGLRDVKGNYDKIVAKYGERFDKTLTIWHAFVYESIRSMDFPRNHPDEGYVELMRTESAEALRAMKIRREDLVNQQTGVRGPLESSSIWQTVKVSGSKCTLQHVPYHRLFGFYWHEKAAGNGGSGFLGDGENEFVFMPEGIPFWYVGGTRAGTPAADVWSKLKVR